MLVCISLCSLRRRVKARSFADAQDDTLCHSCSRMVFCPRKAFDRQASRVLCEQIDKRKTGVMRLRSRPFNRSGDQADRFERQKAGRYTRPQYGGHRRRCAPRDDENFDKCSKRRSWVINSGPPRGQFTLALQTLLADALAQLNPALISCPDGARNRGAEAGFLQVIQRFRRSAAR